MPAHLIPELHDLATLAAFCSTLFDFMLEKAPSSILAELFFRIYG